MSRLSKEREAEIRQLGTLDFGDGALETILDEITALRAERDEAIVGAYRAAAEIAEKHAMQKQGYEFEWDRRELHAGGVTARQIGKEILALTPQSALDAVERDRREIAEAALQTERSYQRRMNYWSGTEDDKPPLPTAADVLAKVKRA